MGKRKQSRRGLAVTLGALLSLHGVGGAQIMAPQVTITPGQVPSVAVAQEVLVQPARVEARLGVGFSTATLTFSLLSPVSTEVFLRSPDARLVVRGEPGSPVRLTAFTAQTVSVLALAAHTGALEVLNREGRVIGHVPYVVGEAKQVNQGLSLNYSPSSDRLGLSYALSGVQQSIFDPRWSAGVNLSVNTGTGKVTGGVSLNVSW